ncbi:hypothetical protein GCM10011581_46060 [Saccharopolyspora subtropica]|uniref:Uncharacterized protein n=1 Tax=Saccharopolyspora thermophila TaxID=89367 RepID=A0A917K9Y1_9PSEU|nr:hypothetical protein GCM10011581_46060 [Saccharopolyspora subtropica]
MLGDLVVITKAAVRVSTAGRRLPLSESGPGTLCSAVHSLACPTIGGAGKPARGLPGADGLHPQRVRQSTASTVLRPGQV